MGPQQARLFHALLQFLIDLLSSAPMARKATPCATLWPDPPADEAGWMTAASQPVAAGCCATLRA